MYLLLPSVTIDIVGQNYRKGAKVKYPKRATPRSFNPFGLKVSSSYCQKDLSFSKALYIIGLVK